MLQKNASSHDGLQLFLDCGLCALKISFLNKKKYLSVRLMALICLDVKYWFLRVVEMILKVSYYNII